MLAWILDCYVPAAHGQHGPKWKVDAVKALNVDWSVDKNIVACSGVSDFECFTAAFFVYAEIP